MEPLPEGAMFRKILCISNVVFLCIMLARGRREETGKLGGPSLSTRLEQSGIIATNAGLFTHAVVGFASSGCARARVYVCMYACAVGRLTRCMMRRTYR